MDCSLLLVELDRHQFIGIEVLLAGVRRVARTFAGACLRKIDR